MREGGRDGRRVGGRERRTRTYLAIRKLNGQDEGKLVPIQGDGLVTQRISALHRHVDPMRRKEGRDGERDEEGCQRGGSNTSSSLPPSLPPCLPPYLIFSFSSLQAYERIDSGSFSAPTTKACFDINRGASRPSQSGASEGGRKRRRRKRRKGKKEVSIGYHFATRFSYHLLFSYSRFCLLCA